MTDKEDYQQQLTARLDQMDAEIKALQARAEVAKADANVEAKSQIDDLQDKRDKARKKLEQLRGSADEAWDDIKAGADSAWENLNTAFKNARKRFE